MLQLHFGLFTGEQIGYDQNPSLPASQAVTLTVQIKASHFNNLTGLRLLPITAGIH